VRYLKVIMKPELQGKEAQLNLDNLLALSTLLYESEYCDSWGIKEET
jgi:hypothetical protein